MCLINDLCIYSSENFIDTGQELPVNGEIRAEEKLQQGDGLHDRVAEPFDDDGCLGDLYIVRVFMPVIGVQNHGTGVLNTGFGIQNSGSGVKFPGRGLQILGGPFKTLGSGLQSLGDAVQDIAT